MVDNLFIRMEPGAGRKNPGERKFVRFGETRVPNEAPMIDVVYRQIIELRWTDEPAWVWKPVKLVDASRPVEEQLEECRRGWEAEKRKYGMKHDAEFRAGWGDPGGLKG